MCAKSLFLVCGFAFVSLAIAAPQANLSSDAVDTARNSMKQVQNTGKRIASRINEQASALPQTVRSSTNNAAQTLSNIRIENAADIDKLISEIEKAADNIYNLEIANIQSWSQDKVLADFQKQAEEGLAIARDRLKESAQEVRQEVTSAIENAQANMSQEEFSKYLKELQRVIEVELAPARQYFMDAAEAITQVSNEMAPKTGASASRSQKKSATSKNKNVSPQATKATITVA